MSWAVLTLLSALWALATPIGASPDEPAHMIKAASVVRGEFLGTASSSGNIVHVPQYVAWIHAQTCYAFNADVTADCSPEVPGDPSTVVESRTTAGLYNPVYYLAVGWPTLLFDTSLGIYAMRAVGVILSTLFLALSFMMVSRWRRPTLATAALVIVTTPMLLFLSASVNPNALETTATLAVFVSMLSILREPDDSLLVQRCTILTIAAAIAVNARGLSLIWVALAIALPLFLVPVHEVRQLLRRRAVIGSAIVVGLSSGFAIFWLLRTNSLAAAVTDPDAQNLFPGVGQPALYGFLSVLERTFGFSSQLIGLFGWMDTPSPTSVTFVWAVAMGALVIGALGASRGRNFRVFVSLVLAFVLLPPIIQGAYVTSGGYIWQGRYIFPVFACMLMAAGAFAAPAFDRVQRRTRSRLIVLGVLAIALAQIYIFAVVLRRYVVGADATWLEFFREPKWDPPLNYILLIILFGISASASYLIVGRFLSRSTFGVVRPSNASPGSR